MLQEIKVKVMKLLATNKDKISKWNGDFSPTALKLYNDYMAITHYWKIEFNGDFGDEINQGDDRHIVDLQQKKCTYRVWKLSGITCPMQSRLYYMTRVITNPLVLQQRSIFIDLQS